MDEIKEKSSSNDNVVLTEEQERFRKKFTNLFVGMCLNSILTYLDFVKTKDTELKNTDKNN